MTNTKNIFKTTFALILLVALVATMVLSASNVSAKVIPTPQPPLPPIASVSEIIVYTNSTGTVCATPTTGATMFAPTRCAPSFASGVWTFRTIGQLNPNKIYNVYFSACPNPIIQTTGTGVIVTVGTVC